MLSYYVSLRSKFCVVVPVTISAQKRCSVRLYLQLLVGGRMPYLGCSVRLYLQLLVGGRMPYLGCSFRLYLQLLVGRFMS